MDDWTNSLRGGWRRLSAATQAVVDDTVSEFREKGVSGVLRESAADVADVWKEISDDAAQSMTSIGQEAKKGYESTKAWVLGGPSVEDSPGQGSTASANSVPRPPVAPAAPMPVPRLEQMRKGVKVFRKGEPAEIVKVDYEVDPPSLVVRMLNDGREVGTTHAHVSLGIEVSQRCLQPGVRVRLVGLQGRVELNGAQGTVVDFRPDLGRWNVRLATSEDLVCVRPGNISVLLAGVEELSQDTRGNETSGTLSQNSSVPRSGPASAADSADAGTSVGAAGSATQTTSGSSAGDPSSAGISKGSGYSAATGVHSADSGGVPCGGGEAPSESGISGRSSDCNEPTVRPAPASGAVDATDVPCFRGDAGPGMETIAGAPQKDSGTIEDGVRHMPRPAEHDAVAPQSPEAVPQ